jgi:predicted Zn-dependent protease
MKHLLVILVSGVFVCCGQNKNTSLDDAPEVIEADTICSCPQGTIKLLPYDNFSKMEAERLLPKLQQEFDKWLDGYWKFEIMDPTHLPQSSYIKERNRYKVTPILNYQSTLLKGNEVIIGLTHKDICTSIHGVKDYGIVGISRLNRQVCVVSDKRLKDKSLYWKPILHEFIHTFYGANHCPNDDPRCFMKDAKGHGNFEIQNKLCDSCKH